ncbi:hypothetical protein PVAG01_08193 [Phlyctema vagabunda]|uniref:Pheromone receptor n=1 Tax=Phlyctema vagabunda TaxID=108571 RepID=A0ABR4P8Q4_9HELO
MSHISIRDVQPFPPGDNSSDTIIAGEHLNLDTLRHFNYQYYSNRTFSNHSHCYLAFLPNAPDYLDGNGRFYGNATDCFQRHSIWDLERGVLDVISILTFFLAFVVICTNISRCAKDPRPTQCERHHRYWLAVCVVFGSLFIAALYWTDFHYLATLSVVFLGVAWYFILIVVTILVRQRAQISAARTLLKRDLAFLRDQILNFNDVPEPPRERLAMFILFVVYTTIILLVTIMPWAKIPKQHSAELVKSFAGPVATRAKLKAAAFMLLIPWFLIFFTLKPDSQPALVSRLSNMSRSTQIEAGGILLPIVYTILSTFMWRFSPFNSKVNAATFHVLGVIPLFLVLVLIAVSGLKDGQYKKLYDRYGHVPTLLTDLNNRNRNNPNQNNQNNQPTPGNQGTQGNQSSHNNNDTDIEQGLRNSQSNNNNNGSGSNSGANNNQNKQNSNNHPQHDNLGEPSNRNAGKSAENHQPGRASNENSAAGPSSGHHE